MKKEERHARAVQRALAAIDAFAEEVRPKSLAAALA
jgi:hypothetical protein